MKFTYSDMKSKRDGGCSLLENHSSNLSQFFLHTLVILFSFISILFAPLAMNAWAIQNSVTGSLAGSNMDLTNATVTLNLIANNAPVGGFTADDVIPQSQISEATDGLGIMTINWKGRDDQSDNVTLNSFQYSDDGGTTWYTPNNGDVSAALSASWGDNGGAGWTTNITLALASTHSFTFDTKHADITAVQSLDGIDQSDLQIRFVLNDGNVDSANASTSESFRVDNVNPTSTITSGSYDAVTDTMIIRGSNFTTMAAATTEISSFVNWSLFQWDINGDDTLTTDVTFSLADVSSLTVTNDTTLTLVFTGTKGTALESTTGFGSVGGS